MIPRTRTRIELRIRRIEVTYASVIKCNRSILLPVVRDVNKIFNSPTNYTNSNFKQFSNKRRRRDLNWRTGDFTMKILYLKIFKFLKRQTSYNRENIDVTIIFFFFSFLLITRNYYNNRTIYTYKNSL